MSELGSPVESPIPESKLSQEIVIDDVVNNKRSKRKLSSDLFEKLLNEGKLEKQTNGCFQAAEGVLKEIENQGLLDELENLDTVASVISTSEVASDSKNPPIPVFQKRRGRPRKGTYVPRSSNSELSPIPSSSKVMNYNSMHCSLRKSDALKIEDSTDAEYHSGVDQTSFRGKSKRRRQPKVLDDYVTDFDTSDEEIEKFSISPAFQFSRQRRGRGRSKRHHTLQSFENDDILSYYLGDFDKKFSEQDFFDDKFLEEIHESNEEEDISTLSDTKSTIDATVSGRRDPLTACLTNKASDIVDVEVDADTNTTPGQKKRGRKNTVRTHHQLAALQQRYCQLLQKYQKKPQVNKVVDLVHGASKLLSEEQLVFLTLQLKSSCKNLQGVRFSAREKVLALAIYAHSPETYKWLQSIFYLPTKLILDRWLEAIAKNNPETAKKLIYYIYDNYIFNS